MTTSSPTSRPLSVANLDAPEPSVSRFELERYLAGDVAAARAQEIAALLASDPALRAKHDALAAELQAADAAFKVEVPLERFLADHSAKVAPPSLLSRLLRSTGFQAGLGLCAAAAVVAVVVTRPTSGGEDAGYDGLKGGARVGFFVRDTASAHTGVDGEQLGAGSQIQFAVRDDISRQAMVLVGVDGRGEVTVYDAESLSSERPKGDGKPRLLGDSVVLDDSTGAERFFVVYGDVGVDELKAKVEHAAQELAASHADLSTTSQLPLSSSFVQSSVHIVKVPPR